MTFEQLIDLKGSLPEKRSSYWKSYNDPSHMAKPVRDALELLNFEALHHAEDILFVKTNFIDGYD